MQFKPSEPHLVPYLTDIKGFSTHAVNREILPVSLYASLVFFVLAGPIASLTSTKTVLLVGAGCKLVTRGLLLWGRTIRDMRTMQVAFAAGAASDLMAYAYLAAMCCGENGGGGDVGVGGGDESGGLDAGHDTNTQGRSAQPNTAEGSGHTQEEEPGRVSQKNENESKLRFATGAVSASGLVGYMLAAEVGQGLFENGWSYETLFWISFFAVGLGFVGIAALPDDGRGKRAEQSDGPASFRKRFRFSRPSFSPSKFATTVYGSTSVLVLSLWWVFGTPGAHILETYVLSLLKEIDGNSDAGGHVVFFTRGLSAIFSLLAARLGPKIAAAPETYVSASIVACLFGYLFSVSTSILGAGFFYAISTATVHGVSVLAFSQCAVCVKVCLAISRGDLYEQVHGGVVDASVQGDEEVDIGVVDGRFAGEEEYGRDQHDQTEQSRNTDTYGLLFGVNGALALLVLVVAQAAIDACGASVRGASVAAAATSLIASVCVLAAAAYRRLAMHTNWALTPTPPDVSYKWLQRWEGG